MADETKDTQETEKKKRPDPVEEHNRRESERDAARRERSERLGHEGASGKGKK